MSQTYNVIWEIQIDADSPREAAEQALTIMRDPKSSAQHFEIIDEDGNGQPIELLEEEEEEELCSEVRCTLPADHRGPCVPDHEGDGPDD